MLLSPAAAGSARASRTPHCGAGIRRASATHTFTYYAVIELAPLVVLGRRIKMIDRTMMNRLDLRDAVKRELALRNRLLPRRWDYLALAGEHAAVEAAIRPLIRWGPSGTPADVVLSDKGWRGMRPLHVMTLTDRVLYRALVELIRQTLPENLRQRCPVAEFRQAPLDLLDAAYISKTDVTAYYEFVDHQNLADELIDHTGEEPAIEVLTDLLGEVMGRRVGLPQVHTASDVLGDTYIDQTRRRLLRRGHATFTYSDDFRIASASLGEARAALEACAEEVRALGLVLNDRKTYTYRTEKYRRSLTSFADAEKRLFVDDEDPDSNLALSPRSGFLAVS